MQLAFVISDDYALIRRYGAFFFFTDPIYSIIASRRTAVIIQAAARLPFVYGRFKLEVDRVIIHHHGRINLEEFRAHSSEINYSD